MPRDAVVEVLTTGLSRSLSALAGCERTGVDAVHIPTWERHLQLGGALLLDRTYQPQEIAFCDGRVERLAARLAAKEAVLKVLGTGIRGVGLRDVEVVSTPEGRPTIGLHGPAGQALAAVRLDHIEVSLCHEHEYALAVALGVGRAGQS